MVRSGLNPSQWLGLTFTFAYPSRRSATLYRQQGNSRDCSQSLSKMSRIPLQDKGRARIIYKDHFVPESPVWDIGMSPASNKQLTVKYGTSRAVQEYLAVFPTRLFRKISRAASITRPNEFSRRFYVLGVIGHHRFCHAPFRSSVDSKPYILA